MLARARSALGAAGAGALLGGILYVGADLASDVYTVGALRRRALEVANHSVELGRLLGSGPEQPLRAAPLWQTTLAYTQRGHVAHCTVPVHGSAANTDVVVRAARRAGYRSTFLYNFVGAGAWDVLSCSAMFPGEGGVAQPRSLLPMPDVTPEAAAAAARVRPATVAAGSFHSPPPGQQAAGPAGEQQAGGPQQQQQQQQQQAAEAASGEHKAGGAGPPQAQPPVAAGGDAAQPAAAAPPGGWRSWFRRS